MSDFTLDELCAVACAEAFRGDGEILASPFGQIPAAGARLARATFAPDLLFVDDVEAYLPYRSLFDVVWSGRRHAMMGASQIDRFGNQNIACIGDFRRPKAQLLGVRGAPSNTINHTTSYFIPQHSPRTFVAAVDFVSGVGHDRARALGPGASRFHCIRRVISDKGVFDFETADRSMRLRSVHPGVSVEEVVKSTGFALIIPDQVEETRAPTEEERTLLLEFLR